MFFHCSYVIPSLAASVVINIPKYFESTLHYYPVGEIPTLLDNGTTVNVTQYQVEYDRTPNFSYLPNRNILLNPNYSAKCRILEYYALTANRQLFGFGKIFCKIFCRIFWQK